MMPRGGTPSARQFQGMPPSVSVADKSDNEADTNATQLLVEAYTRDGVFICPKCKAEISDKKKAISHLADEINKSLAEFARIMEERKAEVKK